MSTYQTLPISARTEVSLGYKFTPIILTKREGETTLRTDKNRRKLPKVSDFNYSVYVNNLVEIEAFLMARIEAIPFYLPQDSRLYVCKGYTATYQRVDRGTISMNLIHLPV
jgi:hypothetical protein